MDISWTIKLHVLEDLEDCTGPAKHFESRKYIVAANIILLCFFLNIFFAVVQVRFRVLMLWVLVMIWDPGAQSCQVQLQIPTIILMLILFIL